jgi:hypothetical protein
MYWPRLCSKILQLILLVPPDNEIQQSVNWAARMFGLASWMMKLQCKDVNWYSKYRPPSWAIMLVTISLLPLKNDHKQSAKDYWSCVLDNQMVQEWGLCIIIQSATFVGPNANNNIATTIKNWVATEHQQYWWRLCKLHSNDLHCIVPELSY